MSRTERIYALLVEANPVPDPEALPERLADAGPRLVVVDPRREPMQTEATQPQTEPPGRRAWIPALAVAAAIIAAVAIGAFVLSDGDPQPAVDPDAGPVGRVEAYYTAVNAGDVEAAVALVAPNESPSEVVLSNIEFNAVMNAEYPWLIEECAEAASLPTAVLVECGLLNTDPVFVATEASEFIAPWTVNDDGSMRAHEWQGGDHTGASRAYADYLRAFHLEDYEAVCSPTAYPGGSVAYNGGLALTGVCARVILPLAPEIADWVEAGKPGS